MPWEANRTPLEQVVAEVVDDTADVQFVSPGPSWLAHDQFRGDGGLVSHLLTSAEWQDARFEVPRRSVFVLTSTDQDEVRSALTKLAGACVEYLQGHGEIDRKRGLFRSRKILVLRTAEREWRIGPRSAVVPHSR